MLDHRFDTLAACVTKSQSLDVGMQTLMHGIAERILEVKCEPDELVQLAAEVESNSHLWVDALFKHTPSHAVRFPTTPKSPVLVPFDQNNPASPTYKGGVPWLPSHTPAAATK